MKSEEKERSYTTVTIGKKEAEKLKKLAAGIEISQTEFVNKMVRYFEKTGINPADPIETPAAQLAEMNKRLNQVIAFQKDFEKNKLQPVLDELVKTDQRLKTIPEDIKNTNLKFGGLIHKTFLVDVNNNKTATYYTMKEFKETMDKTLNQINSSKYYIENNPTMIKNELAGVNKILEQIMAYMEEKDKGLFNKIFK